MKHGPNPGETIDILGNDQLFLIQPEKGYRFSIDSLLLWGFLTTDPKSYWIDLGTGCGIIAIVLAKISEVERVTALEVQPELVELARRNVSLNHVESHVTLLEADIRDHSFLSRLPKAEGVCTNPPYYPVYSGRINPNMQKAMARHEIGGTLSDFIKAGSLLLGRGGYYTTILPVARLQEALALFSNARLYTSRMRFVHSYKDEKATLVLIEALKEKQAALTVDPPITVYQSPGTYTPEVQALINLSPLKQS